MPEHGAGVVIETVTSKSNGAAAAVSALPLQVRGRSFTAVVLRLTGAADQAFYEALDSLMRQAPHFFVNAPLVLDLEQAGTLQLKGDFVKVVRELRARRLSVIGIQNGTPDQGTAAFGAGLITLQGGREAAIERAVRPAAAAATSGAANGPTLPEPAPAAAESPAAEPAPSLVITEPVRSGQRIFADRGDLVVVSSVSSGAELIAHGNIHIYGPLRGRALAGVNGDRNARIFCQSLEAELIAIAGLYRTSDDLGATVRQHRVQAFLDGETLCIEPLK